MWLMSSLLTHDKGLSTKRAKRCRVIAYLIDFAKQRQLTYKQDSTGNMVISRPGSGGGENAPVVIIQVTALSSHASTSAL